MYKSKKIKRIDYLGNASKLLTIMASLGVVLGGILVQNYLNFIQHPSIFAEVMSEPSSLIAILVVLGSFFFLLFIGFIAPCCFFVFWPDIYKNHMSMKYIKLKLALFISLSSPLIIYIIFTVIILIYDLSKKELPNNIITDMFLLVLVLPLLVYTSSWIYFYKKFFYEKVKSCEMLGILEKIHMVLKQNFKPFITILFPIVLFIAMTAPTQFFIIISTATWLPDGEIQYLYIFIFLGLLLFNLFIVTRYLSSYSNRSKENKSIFMSALAFTFLILLLVTMWSNNFALHMFLPIRFVETPQHSAWYLLYNNFQQNNGRQEINGIDKMDLRRLKKNFSCSSLLNEQIKAGKEKKSNCSTQPERRNNALYGYMAWNLGNTKVFCPATIHNDKGREESKKIASYCITINAKSLQIMNSQYIDIMPKER